MFFAEVAHITLPLFDTKEVEKGIFIAIRQAIHGKPECRRYPDLFTKFPQQGFLKALACLYMPTGKAPCIGIGPAIRGSQGQQHLTLLHQNPIDDARQLISLLSVQGRTALI